MVNINAMSEDLKAGDKNYKAYVGPMKNYDIVSQIHFSIITSMGLRQHHNILDLGCGSLRTGKLLIPYLLKGNYFGIEPNKWLVEEGLKHELGEGIMQSKAPNFHHFDDFKLSRIGEKFNMIFAHSIFTHASEAQIRTCLAEAQKVLLRGAVFITNFSIGQTNYTGEDWVYPGCVDYTIKKIREMGEDAGLAVLQTKWRTPHEYQTTIFTDPQVAPRVFREVANLPNSLIGSNADFFYNKPIKTNVE